MPMQNEELEIRFKELSEVLLNELNNEGFWSGRLSSSALAVAVAVAALHFYDAEENGKEIQSGLEWLKSNINNDGSYGDTPESAGNLSTSLLVYAALNLYASHNDSISDIQKRLAAYLQKNKIDTQSDQVAEAILRHYKKDFTFSVPILTMCALCGIPEKNAFKNIPQLPFELALFPRKIYRWLNLSVVSYAIPALIAVGIVVFKKKKTGNLIRWIRSRAEKKAMQILQKSMPQSGGFLEAVPLTAFVLLSLINAGHKENKLVEKGIGFLKRMQRDDGGFPIDVDLSTWVTSLSIKALGKRKDDVLSPERQDKLVRHLKAVQNKGVHPFNATSPGGWGWTNFSGSVPDGDDTPGAILALLHLAPGPSVMAEVVPGIKWLLQLQNKDGGFPTFSKGWGKLPFDRSCADLTGHVLLAFAATLDRFSPELSKALKRRLILSISKAVGYLQKHQRPDGSWVPLWFGNQFDQNHENPVYGTARVLSYLNDALSAIRDYSGISRKVRDMILAAENFLVYAQNNDGSWGGNKGLPGTIEESSLAISALQKERFLKNRQDGFKWLDGYFKENGLVAAPIGLYFASLWYDEKMYPLTAYMEAIVRSAEADAKRGS